MPAGPLNIGPLYLGRKPLDAVARFAGEAASFAEWAEADTMTGEFAARDGLLRLTRLYLAALELPASWAGDADVPGARVTDAETRAVFANARRLPLDFYGEVYDPLPIPAEAPLLGSLADDIADIHRDVLTGLRLYRAGRHDEAIWNWTFSLQSHWGEHVTGAIRALHCWLARNAPLRLSAEV